ncbi:MAG: DUF3014 domain-containing protein, partial [Desulfuromonadales bacterium]|nr:DUF3014 domain-containing protein [Desulfuromonadales bacterium]
MKNWPFQLGFVVIAAIVAFAGWQFYQSQPIEQTAAPAIPTAPEKPAPIQHPIVVTPQELSTAAPLLDVEKALPELTQSDETMAEFLSRLFAEQTLERFFVRDHIIERLVVTIDNLPRGRLPVAQRPLKQIEGAFLAHQDHGKLAIDSANYRRYDPLVELLAALDQQQMVAAYKQLYPLFQQAYKELGNPKGYFNDRLIEVIDHLLSGPQVSDPVFLTQP